MSRLAPIFVPFPFSIITIESLQKKLDTVDERQVLKGHFNCDSDMGVGGQLTCMVYGGPTGISLRGLVLLEQLLEAYLFPNPLPLPDNG